MKISSIEAKIFKAPYLKPFTIALGTIMATETVLLRIVTEDGLTGYGEGSPYHAVTGNYPEDILHFVNRIRGKLIGADADDIAGIHALLDFESAASTPAKAAIDIALYDLKGKRANMPLYRLLGGSRPNVYSDCTIGIKLREEMVAHARELVDQGFTILKIKTGVNIEDDIGNLAAIRKEVGDGITLRIDANQGWDVKGTILAMKKMEALGIDEVEQPLRAFNLEGHAFIRNHISQNLMLDESVHSPVDALKAVKAGAADIINIKLMKSAGILPALKINAIAEAAGIPCMVGCMLETWVGVTAGAHLAASQPNITLADLDSHIKLNKSSIVTGGFEQHGSNITLTEKPGLGVDVDWTAL